MIKTKPKPAEQAITAPGFDYDGLPQTFVSASRKRATTIKTLDLNTGNNVLKMGRLLKEQQEAFGSISEQRGLRGGETWDAWVKAELGWASGYKYAHRIIQMHDTFGHIADAATCLGFELMRQLAAKNAEPIREKVLEMARRGEKPTHDEVARMKKEAVLRDDRPTPTEAKQRAKETGEVVIGSDNRFYTPMDEEAVEAHADKTQRTYDVLDAISLFAALPIDAETWLGEAEPHTLADLNLGSIEAARAWLAQLADLYRHKEGIVDGN